MQYGINLLLWTSHVTKQHESLLRDLKKAGYDGVEVPVFEGDVSHYAAMGEMLDRIGLSRTTVGILPSAEKNSISSDAVSRKAAVDHTKWILDRSSALGATIVAGPMHSALGVFSGAGPTAQERKRGISYHRAVGDYAAKKNLKFSLEALNRFECYFLNTMQQLSDYLDEVDHPAIKAMYDTFHANIEEKDPVAAIRTIRKHLIHVHISENDRGTPGKGHVPFEATYKGLRAIKYDGYLTIEAFGRALPAIASATRVWRDFFPSQESCYRDGIKSMKKGWANA